MKRRSVLAGAGFALSTGLAGCLSDDDENNNEVDLCRLEVSNYDDSTHNISLRVMDGDDELYARDEEVEAGHEDYASGFSVPPAELPEDPGSYLVRARLNDNDWREQHLPDVAQEHVGIIAMIHPADDQQPFFELLFSSDQSNSCLDN